MLVLSLQRDESLSIGLKRKIQTTVVDIRGDKVRLGITAPRWLDVHRTKVLDMIDQERAQAVRNAAAEIARLRTTGQAIPPVVFNPNDYNMVTLADLQSFAGGEIRDVNGTPTLFIPKPRIVEETIKNRGIVAGGDILGFAEPHRRLRSGK